MEEEREGAEGVEEESAGLERLAEYRRKAFPERSAASMLSMPPLSPPPFSAPPSLGPALLAASAMAFFVAATASCCFYKKIEKLIRDRGERVIEEETEG